MHPDADRIRVRNAAWVAGCGLSNQRHDESVR